MVVCIAGGGVVGVCTAYYLAKEGKSCIVIDRKGIAGAASGRAGGFLAKTWNDGSPTADLTHRSYELHAELGRELVGTDYRTLTCAGITVGGSLQKPSNQKLKNIEWVSSQHAQSIRNIGNENIIAQVHPKKFCQAIFARAQSLADVTYRQDIVKGVLFADDDSRRVKKVVLGSGHEIDNIEAIIFAMGPWNHVLGLKSTAKQCDIHGFELKLPPMTGTKYHSLCLQSKKVLNQAVFFHGRGDLEVYPRPDGEVYVTGLPEPPTVVNDLPGETAIKADIIHALTTTFNDLSDSQLPINSKQACHLPSTPDGLPIIGPIPDLSNAFVASGLGCWGILLAPATAQALVSTFFSSSSSPCCDISQFDPSRFLRFRWFSSSGSFVSE
mmetsp:Transcript_9687/g.13451  ORF Transcript_9687/g.13451 Transcript_9687/m.13451 type:complete len:383 (-) Transcript_9687:84-1232(-)|eukprot:CAMPEP_0197285112 /NCGR_PEP_ID=MMETSP0890-20130614/272_1 /TAXON_ID=44058 ORGANISM="Aureoumbra lagunensis, Strain CCMP1510" /NCGR_SAMPLE_ID=MMETSP0890 /ASSEMBLY_ACC=CAM_ASM_000533 /LENGTH=382 /DNA_ID=CAMNT_0042752303 /DNA_START=118 /DNA_END=1266 /DNA_ORIENTATION=+